MSQKNKHLDIVIKQDINLDNTLYSLDIIEINLNHTKNEDFNNIYLAMSGNVIKSTKGI